DYPNKVVKIADIQPPIVNTNDLVGVDMSNYDANKLRKYIVTKGDYVLAMTGATIGKLGRITEDIKAYINQRVLTFRPNESIVDKDYLYYQLCSFNFNQYILNHIDSETAQPNISAGSVGGFEVALPSLEEQRRIAGILGAIDDKIENNRRINTNLELQAQALFDNLMSNSNLEYKLIADIDHIIETGRRPKGGVANITSGVPSIGAENIKGLGKYDYSKTKYITAEFAETLKKGIIKGYELLIYKDGGKPGYFIPNFSIFGEGFPYDNMTLNEHVFLLDFGNKGYNFFAYFYMQTEEVMKYLNAQGSKAAIPGINRNDVENISIPTIENEAVKEFCERIEPIITSILVNSKESSRLATLRDTLLPKLINGEIKL
ncbi:MAG: restriction endonuclease subunit S, partial [Alistipes sp.]|nr:restriction endonuclease subunit S [Alistipes sp.]